MTDGAWHILVSRHSPHILCYKNWNSTNEIPSDDFSERLNIKCVLWNLIILLYYVLIYLFQVALGLQTLHDLSQSTGTSAIIMLGDYNTPPNFPAYSFLREGRVTDITRQSVMDKTDKGGILTPVCVHKYASYVLHPVIKKGSVPLKDIYTQPKLNRTDQTPQITLLTRPTGSLIGGNSSWARIALYFRKYKRQFTSDYYQGGTQRFHLSPKPFYLPK